ncbi:hypothetical protein EMIHUDRAFT_231415 [Emiliania huxleyi CCMP1516]|uniref:Membrane transport protein MMPL domain-containing protein n=2 Tax=Emiliania huxleyi TaxID=2903 RepID=A0A0D3K7P6_EMIH1|nr:hypothetical protein EMIHUDRAFT_231415 [Emiliania huxleyi CCMP1516]EOD31781.1 hypothetical protein EMIHUDRAFT_231415 [Emiliania huxleyi CCMP1516]|eukprot:XP_005784210.1 hypothetical protein EMIHUDRAFT_231415 [Emiliania huxleyi CCMP1516]
MDTPGLSPTSACVDPGSASSSGLRTTEGPEITVGVHGGEAAALVPAGIKEYVRLLGGCKLRCWIMLMWLILTLSGLSVYFPLTLVLDIAIEPPFGSASERAKDLYEEHYPAGEPVFLAAMLSTTAPHKLFNTDARPYPVGYPPFLDYNPGEGADLIKEAEGIFDDVIDVLKPYLEENGGRCQWNIYNFFSWEVLVEGFAVMMAPIIFPPAHEGREGMLPVHLVSCDGRPIYKECVFKREPFCEPIEQVLKDLEHYRADRSPSNISMTFDIILGIEFAMLLSTAATVPSLVVLAYMLRNMRQLLLVGANILTAIGSSLLIIYPLSHFVMDVCVVAPTIAIAVALAMSIDYSLFLLTRFNEEQRSGSPVPEALSIAIATQGHTIVVSGATLTLCFTSMLMLPSSTITSIAAGAAIAAGVSVVDSLSLTPSLLLSMPRFFTADRRFGLTLDDTPLDCRRRPVDGDDAAPDVSAAEHGGKLGVWGRLGQYSQRSALVTALLLAAVALPFGLALSRYTYVVDIKPLLQSDHPATDAYIMFTEIYPQSMSTPVELLFLPPNAGDMDSSEWKLASCHMLKDLADRVTEVMRAEGHDYAMSASDFVGMMMILGHCVEEGVYIDGIPLLNMMPILEQIGVYDTGYSIATNADKTATYVYVICQVDVFSEVGEAWMRALRAALPDSNPATWDGVDLGELHLYGVPLDQMDGAEFTTQRMVWVVLAITLIMWMILGGSFGSLLIPMRAVICIGWMIAVTFGAAVAVYQLGFLSFLGISSLKPSAGSAMFWVALPITGPILVGLGLDYDIFLMDSVMENWLCGKRPKEAVAGTIISAAGIVMFFAFGALLVSPTPVLNQVGFMLCVGVLIDCFVTTKITIPTQSGPESSKANASKIAVVDRTSVGEVGEVGSKLAVEWGERDEQEGA